MKKLFVIITIVFCLACFWQNHFSVFACSPEEDGSCVLDPCDLGLCDDPPDPPPPVCIGSTSECAADGGGGGGTGVTASMFYCSQPGSPTGINVKHQCLLDFQAEYSMPGYDYCRYGGAYDLGAGCTYYRDPCRIEDFGATGGACRGVHERNTGGNAACSLVNDECVGGTACGRCSRTGNQEDGYQCELIINDCCTQTSEGDCYNWTLGGDCWWNCASGAVVTPTSTPTPTPTFTPTPTPTNTPTPTPVASASWLKFQNLSIHAYQTPPNIPENPEKFDDTDTINRYLADNSGSSDPGLVSYSDGIIANISVKGWKTTSAYTRATPLLSGGFKNYIQTRKEYKILTTKPVDFTQLTEDGIYYYNVSNGAINGTDSFLEATTNDTQRTPTNKNVLIVDGLAEGEKVTLSKNIVAGSGFALIVNGNLEIAPTVTEINAIIIANTINLVATSNGLKINGNLITNNLDNDRERLPAERLKPIIFTVANNQYYLDLLPYLSTVKYEWGQTE